MATLNLPSRQRGDDLYLLFEARVCSMYIICVLDVSSDTFYRGQPWALVLTFTLREGLLFTITYSRLVGLCTSRYGFVSTFYGHWRSAAITDVCFCVWFYVSPGDLNSGLYACIRGKCFNCWDISPSTHLSWLMEVLYGKELTSLRLAFQQCADSRQHFTLQQAVLS